MLHKNLPPTREFIPTKQNKQSLSSVNPVIKQQPAINPQSIQEQIKYQLKNLVQQKNYINKLIISCILSSLYIQQYNYQEAHKILTDVEKTISKLEQSQENASLGLNERDQLQLAIIKLKMYSNFILIELINLQVKPFQHHLEEALNLIEYFRQKSTQIDKKSKGNNSPSLCSQNANPNTPHNHFLNTTVMLFQLFLKQFTGFDSFEQIQAETLIAQCHTEKHRCNNLQQFFYFSNISFLKLLTTSDYQSAYKLQNSSYQFIQADIQITRQNRQQVSLKQVILKTVSLKKLIYLSQELKLPSQIVKKYKQKLNSSESLQSRYLQGLQENTIFRNYAEKIDLGFRLVSRLKEFQKDVILPLLISINNHKKAKQSSQVAAISNGSVLKLWQCKALKSKFIQVLQSKGLQSNPQAQDNILIVIECLDRAIYRQNVQNSYSSKNQSCQIPVEQMLLLQTLGCTKYKTSPHSLAKKTKKQRSSSLYDSAVTEYQKKLQILTSSISKTIFHPLITQFFSNLQELQQPQIQVEISHVHERNFADKKSHSHEKSHLSDSQESEPSIYLENVQFQIVNQVENNKKNSNNQKNIVESKVTHQKNIHNLSYNQKDYQYDNKYVPKFVIEEKPQKPQQPKKLSPQIKNEPIYHSKITPSLSLSPSNYAQQSKLSPKKNVFMNQKNQIYVNYAQLGSRVKLSQHAKPQQSFIQEINTGKTSKIEKFQTVNHQNNIKTRNNHQESIRKEEGQIEIPHEDSVVKYGAKKYPFEERQVELIAPLSHKSKLEKFGQNNFAKIEFEKEKEKGSIFQKFKLEKSRPNISHVVQISEEQKSVDNNKSLTRSRKKLSSLSPKIPKDSTINSRLNEHIKRHELTYSPESMASGIKQKKPSKIQVNQNELELKQKQVEKEKSISDYSAGLSPNSRSVNKNRPKVQKASRYPKSPISASNPFQTKTIKFKEYMENLEKSGFNIREEQPSAKDTSSKVKIKSRSIHRRIATEVNQTQLQKYDSYMNEAPSKIKPSQTNNKSNILEAFLTDPQQREQKEKMKKRQNIFDRPSSEQGSSPQDNSPINLSYGVVPRTRRTGSELIQIPQQSNINKEVSSNKEVKKTLSRQDDKNKPISNNVTPSNKSQQNNTKKSSVQSQQVELIPSIISSAQFTKKLILKMIKTHQQKLTHAIKLCQNGQYIDKKHYSSDGGDERFLQLSSDHKFIEWAVSENKLLEGHKTKYEMKYVKGVVYGRVTETMRKVSNRHLEPFKCISFIFQKRTFDIYCSQEQDIKFWLPGISYFISQSRPQLNHPNYTTKIQKFIKKREIPLKKDDVHANTVYYSLGRVLWKRMLLKMQFYCLKQKKSYGYKNTNTGAIIEFGKAMAKEKESIKYASMLPPTGKESKMSRDKSLSMNSRVKHQLNAI